MRRLLLALSALALVPACARPPSSAPLGGKEWLAPEPHADRRAPDRAARKEKVAVTPSAAPTPSASGSAESSAKAAPSATPAELRFAWEPFVRGGTIVVDTRYAIHAQFNTRFQGLSTDQKAEVSAHEKIEVRVTEVSDGDVRELELSYLESESVFSLSNTPNDVDSNKGKRYRVSFEHGGSHARVRALSGSADAEQEKGVLFDLATVTGFLPLVRPHVPANLLPGWKTRLDTEQIATVFGRLDSLKLEGAWLTLRGRDLQNSKIAVFDCGLPVRLERDGLAFSVELKGSCTARPRDTRPLELSLRGPLKAELNTAMSAASSISGTLEASISHSYSR